MMPNNRSRYWLSLRKNYAETSIPQHGGNSTRHIALPTFQVTYDATTYCTHRTIDLVIMKETANPSYQTLSKVRSMLDFVLEAPTLETRGVGVGQPGHRKK